MTEEMKQGAQNYTEDQIQVLEGLEGYIVAEKDGRLLVCRLSEEQRIKDFAAGK